MSAEFRQREKSPFVVFAFAVFLSALGSATHGLETTDGIMVPVSEFLPRELISGPEHSLNPEARINRAVAVFKLETSFGNTEVGGTVQLLERINELSAVRKLEAMKKTEVYATALKKSAKAPIDTVSGLATDPVETISGAARGLGGFLADIGYSVVSDNPDQENVAKTLVGFGAAKRQLVVNPYSGFQPLQDLLSEVAWTSVGGSMTVTAAFSTLDSTGGRVVRITSTANTGRKLVRDNSPRKLKKLNAAALKGIGVNPELSESLLDNYHYNAESITRLVMALESMDGVEGRSEVVARAAMATTNKQANHMRDWIELIAAYHARVTPAKRLLVLSTAPFLVDAAGTLHGVFATDFIAHAPAYIASIKTVSELVKATDLRKGPFNASGKIDPEMAQLLRAEGWTQVNEHIERTLRVAAEE